MIRDPKHLLNDVRILQLEVILFSLRMLLEDLDDVFFGLGALPAP